ncbi:hypothetical protein PoB_001466600 [Plakobranchus ocellatus]|uniref:Uncharacterized protein n=1 Tax=Plakobranchus ocellatus TaxID=259542 RepID=A0AAV3YLL5_9GAST|nr:hypothetical protein PoB_001466600 [Plakobranchus ocellatus]
MVQTLGESSGLQTIVLHDPSGGFFVECRRLSGGGGRLKLRQRVASYFQGEIANRYATTAPLTPRFTW